MALVDLGFGGVWDGIDYGLWDTGILRGMEMVEET